MGGERGEVGDLLPRRPLAAATEAAAAAFLPCESRRGSEKRLTKVLMLPELPRRSSSGLGEVGAMTVQASRRAW